MDCQWFLTCDNLATGAISHPILGEVPACDRCQHLAGVLTASVERARAAWEAGK